MTDDPYPELAPFAVDTWPRCEPWERAGVITPADRRAIGTWARTAQRRLRLAIDARFDRILGRMYATAWPGVVLEGQRPEEGDPVTEPETDAQRQEREQREREQREIDEQREREAQEREAQQGADDADDDDDDAQPAGA